MSSLSLPEILLLSGAPSPRSIPKSKLLDIHLRDFTIHLTRTCTRALVGISCAKNPNNFDDIDFIYRDIFYNRSAVKQQSLVYTERERTPERQNEIERKT